MIIIILLKFTPLLQENNEWATGLIILPLISNTVIAELLSYSNEKVVSKKIAWKITNQMLEARQIQQSKKNSAEHDIYIENRREWEVYLEQASLDYSNNPELIEEINRIKQILEYSSFFRSNSSLNKLMGLRESKDYGRTLLMLKSVK